MKAQQIDILLEIPVSEDDIEQARREEFWREGMEYMRQLADQKAAAFGGHVVTDRLPEMGEPQFANRASGIFVGETQNWLLWASRWWVEVPDSFDVCAAAARG
jgi:hypothetical protein